MKFGFRSTFKSLFNVKSWIGWSAISQNGVWIRDMYGNLLRPVNTSPVKETYEQACERYGYTPDFLLHQMQQFKKAVTVYLALFGVGIVYMLWLYYQQKWMAAVVMLPLNFMLFSFYFRESFWLMQMRQKRLGMNFKDWFNIVVLRNGKTS
jgi:hypothetical protein